MLFTSWLNCCSGVQVNVFEKKRKIFFEERVICLYLHSQNEGS